MLYVFGGMTSAGATNDLFALAPFGFWDAVTTEIVNVALNKPATISANDASARAAPARPSTAFSRRASLRSWPA